MIRTSDVRFSTYATWWIRQAVTRGIADRGRTIRLPVHQVETLRRLSHARRELTQKLGRLPTAAEIARRLRMPVAKIRTLVEAPGEPISLEAPIGNGNGAQLGDFLVDRAAHPPDAALLGDDVASHVERALASLSERQREVLRLRFGIGTEREWTLAEIGARLSLTRERIRQIEREALSKLRESAPGLDLKILLEAS